MKNLKNKNAYSLIIIILLIGFMIFLTVGILRLVIGETKNNEAIGNYSKAYIGAESAQEIALLEIKDRGYGFNKTTLSGNILGDDIKTPKITYVNDGKIKNYSGALEPLNYNIIPLFYIKSDGSEEKIENYNLEVLSGDVGKFSWNVIGKDSGVSGNGENMLEGANKSVNNNGIFYNNVKVSDFLKDSKTNYLILFNNSSGNIKYKISSNSYFTKPILTIISSGKIGYFKQNIKTTINYADMVNRSKYSIYSEKYH